MRRNLCSNILSLVFVVFTTYGFGQFIQAGKITFERKTNLLKMGELPDFLKEIAEEQKYNYDLFELYFKEGGSAFIPIPKEAKTRADMLTVKNTVYSNLETKDRMTLLDMMGNKIFIQDTVNKISWTMTDNTRNLAGYECKMAIYRKNDSTNLYAWYAEELIPSVGPETFSGLPGTILGLATEDGGIIYFAKQVETMPVPDETLTYKVGNTPVFTKQGFKDMMIKRMGNSTWVKGMVEGFFFWY